MTEIEKKLWRRVRRFSFVFRICPFLRMASVCNNLAFGKVDDRSDIDIFVIAKTGRLFFVRTFLTLFLHVLGVRRHGKKVVGRFCLSFFVDDSFLDLSPLAIKNDVYLAYWLKSMLPIADDGVSRDLLNRNEWACRFFYDESDFIISDKYVFKKKCRLKKILEWIFKGKVGDLSEKKLKAWQMARARRKIALINKMKGAKSSDLGLVVDDHILKFHNIDRRRKWQQAWIKQWGEEKITDDRFLNLRFL